MISRCQLGALCLSLLALGCGNRAERARQTTRPPVHIPLAGCTISYGDHEPNWVFAPPRFDEGALVRSPMPMLFWQEQGSSTQQWTVSVVYAEGSENQTPEQRLSLVRNMRFDFGESNGCASLHRLVRTELVAAESERVLTPRSHILRLPISHGWMDQVRVEFSGPYTILAEAIYSPSNEAKAEAFLRSLTCNPAALRTPTLQSVALASDRVRVEVIAGTHRVTPNTDDYTPSDSPLRSPVEVGPVSDQYEGTVGRVSQTLRVRPLRRSAGRGFDQLMISRWYEWQHNDMRWDSFATRRLALEHLSTPNPFDTVLSDGRHTIRLFSVHGLSDALVEQEIDAPRDMTWEEQVLVRQLFAQPALTISTTELAAIATLRASEQDASRRGLSAVRQTVQAASGQIAQCFRRSDSPELPYTLSVDQTGAVTEIFRTAPELSRDEAVDHCVAPRARALRFGDGSGELISIWCSREGCAMEPAQRHSARPHPSLMGPIDGFSIPES